MARADALPVATGNGVRIMAWLALLAGVIGTVSIFVGPAEISVRDVIASLTATDGSGAALVIREVRLPRTLLGLAIGATLGLAGAALQGLLRNPLAEPGVIGITATASLGAVLALYSGLAAAFSLALPLGGMLGAGAAVVLLHALAGRYGGTLRLVLSGVALTSLAGALTALSLNFAPNPFAALEIMHWLLGSLADRSWTHVWIAAPFMAAGWALLLTLGRALDALTLGEDAATSLGVDLAAVRRRTILGAALSVGAATSVAGSIGFVGLVVPHLVRPLVRNRPGRLLAASALGGAALTGAADVCIRAITTGAELKLGVLTALIGAPFFLYLVLKTRALGDGPS